MISRLHHYIKEKSFSFSLELLLQEYGQLKAAERIEYDSLIAILSFWRNYESTYFSNSAVELYDLWQQFDSFLIEKNIFNHFETIHLIGLVIMTDIHKLLSEKLIQPQDSSPFFEKILYGKTLLWTENIKDSFFFLSSLVKHYPSEAEPWALLGKIYFLLGDEKKSGLFYREAFFINPSILNLIDIRTRLLDSLLLHTNNQLKGTVAKNNKKVFLQWVAIYSILENFFKMKKKLTVEEKAIVEKRISVYENKYAKASMVEKEDTFLNLLRFYLFQYDYYKDHSQKEISHSILKKIEHLSPMVFSKLSV